MTQNTNRIDFPFKSLNLNDLNSLLLPKNHQEKIEELFLHLIEMEKRIKALEAENTQLKTELHHLKQ